MINTTLVAAPPLPQSVVQTALRSQEVLDLTVKQVQASKLTSLQKQQMTANLRADAATERYSLVRMLASIDPQQQTGIYEVSGYAATPREAQVLANSAAHALLTWDTRRSAKNIERARQTLLQQLANVDARLAAQPGGLESRSLVTTRSDLQEKLGQVSALLRAVSGTLSLVSEAALPSTPIAPKPLRNALLVLLALLFFGTLIAMVLDTFRKRINTTNDLLPIGLPLLGVIPDLKKGIANLQNEVRTGEFFEALGFVRINLASLAASHTRLAISSSQPAEGKSTLTAALATSLAQSGKRVLIVDADVYRPAQLRLWPQSAAQVPDTILRVRGGARLYHEVTRGVDLLVPDRTEGDAADAAHLQDLLSSLDGRYDMCLVDTPPLLIAASALELASRLDGVIMVVGAGTELEIVERAIRTAQTAGSNILGLVLNRTARETTPYSYTLEKPYTAETVSPQPQSERS